MPGSNRNAKQRNRDYRERKRLLAPPLPGKVTDADPQSLQEHTPTEATIGLWEAFEAGYAARMAEEVRAGVRGATEEALRDWVTSESAGVWMLASWFARSGRYVEFEVLAAPKASAAAEEEA